MDKITVGILAAAFILLLILTASLQLLWQKKHFSPKNIIFTVAPSPAYLIVFIPLNIVLGIIDGLFLYLDILVFLTFYCLELLGVFLCIYVLLWKCVITEDSLILYRPFLPVKKISASYITSVKIKKASGATSEREILIGYHQQKKIFSIDSGDVDDFDLLCYFFDLTKRINRTPDVETFTITDKKSEAVCAVIAFIVLPAVWIFLTWDNDELFYHILMASVMLCLIPGGMHALLWKVTVDSHTLSVRNSFGIVRTYEINQITRVEKEEKHVILYVDDKPIAKISKYAENFDYLTMRIPLLSYSDNSEISDLDTPK
ncbi:MAG: hypothetical protein K2J04_02020 [Lachnospiraceae bacterium]|nr:hypothetical protein [Lachnospiraceae bacterium]